MKFNLRILRTALLVVAALGVVLVITLALILESGVLTPRILEFANRRLESAGEIQVSASAVYWRPWSGLVLNDVRLKIPKEFTASQRVDVTEYPPGFSTVPHGHVLAIGKIEIGYRFSGILRGRPKVQRVTLVRPDLDLEELTRWNSRLAEIRGDAAGTEEGEIQERGFRGVAGLAIEDLRILDGRIVGGGGVRLSRLRLAGRLHADEGDWGLTIDDAGGRLRTDTIDEMVELTGALSVMDGAILLDGLHLGAANGRVSFEGRLDPWGPTKSNVLTTGYAIPLERIGSWIEFEHPLLSGNLEFRFRTSGRPDSMNLNGSLRSVDGSGVGRDAHFAAERTGDLFTLNSFRLSVEESRLDLSGHMVLADPPRVDGMAIFADLDPALVLASEDLSILQGLEGTVRFEGVGMKRETFDGSTDVEISKGSIFDFSVDAASIHARVREGELMLNEVRLTRGDSNIEGVASIDARNEVVAEFQGTIADLADLGDLTKKSPSEALAGTAWAEVRVFGPLRSPDLEATLRFENAKVLGAQARTLEVNLASERLGKDAELSIVARGEDIGYGERLIPVGTAAGAWHAGSVSVTNLRFESDRRGELRLNGDLDVTREGRLTGQIAQLEVRSPGNDVRWINRGPILIERDEESLEFTGLDLQSGSGHIRSDISVRRSGELFVQATGAGVDLAVFSPFLLLPEPLGGLLEFEAAAIIGADTLSANVQLTLRDGRYGDDTLERIEGGFQMSDDRVAFENLEFRSSFATAALNGIAFLEEGNFRAALADSARRKRILEQMVFEDLEADFQSPDMDRVREVFPWLPSPGGAGSFQARIDGPSVRPRVEVRAELIGGRLGVEDLDAFEADGSYDGEVLSVHAARFESDGGTLETHGHLPLQWSLASPKPRLGAGDLNLEFVADRLPTLALTAIIPLFEMTDGRIRAEGRLTGETDDLYLEGNYFVEDGMITIPTFDRPLVRGEVVGGFNRDGVELSSGRFSDGEGGEVSGKGRVTLDNLGLEAVAIDVQAQDYHYKGIAGIQGLGDGRLAITVQEVEDGRKIPEFTGAFAVSRLDLDERIFLPPGVEASALEMPPGVTIPVESTRRFDEAEEEPPPEILARLAFTADNNAWLRTEEMDVEMAGDLTLHITREFVGVTGLVRSLRGSYSVLNTEFDIEKGEVAFTDRTDVETGYVDAVATTRVGDEDITALVTGPMLEPIIDLQSESGLTTAEIYELLLLRRDAAGANEEGAFSKAFQASVVARIANQLGRDIVQELGFDTFDLDVEGQTTNLGVGKRFSSDFFVKYTQQVGGNQDEPESEISSSLEGPERQLLLEYRLSEIFQLQVEQGKIAGEEYFNGDLWAEWGY